MPLSLLGWEQATVRLMCNKREKLINMDSAESSLKGLSSDNQATNIAINVFKFEGSVQ